MENIHFLDNLDNITILNILNFKDLITGRRRVKMNPGYSDTELTKNIFEKINYIQSKN